MDSPSQTALRKIFLSKMNCGYSDMALRGFLRGQRRQFSPRGIGPGMGIRLDFFDVYIMTDDRYA